MIIRCMLAALLVVVVATAGGCCLTAPYFCLSIFSGDLNASIADAAPRAEIGPVGDVRTTSTPRSR